MFYLRIGKIGMQSFGDLQESIALAKQFLEIAAQEQVFGKDIIFDWTHSKVSTTHPFNFQFPEFNRIEFQEVQINGSPGTVATVVARVFVKVKKLALKPVSEFSTDYNGERSESMDGFSIVCHVHPVTDREMLHIAVVGPDRFFGG